MLLRKKARSRFFAKPASCESVCSLTSTTVFTPAFFNRPKKFSAVDWVKPMVKRLEAVLLICPVSG